MARACCLVDLIVVVVAVLSLTSPWSGVVATGVAVNCGVCEKSRCPELHYCEGEAVMDHCGCCKVCSSSKYQPHPLHISANNDENNDNDDHDVNDESKPDGRACAQVKCPKFKICMENMQGLPLCTCPGTFICNERRSRQRSVCGSDGVTYDSRCHLRIAACNAAARIRVARRGPCTGSEAPRPRTCDDLKSCRRRRNQSPVCGLDGRTYSSRCHMKIAGCQKGVKIKVKHHGKCSSDAAGPARAGSVAVIDPSTSVPARLSGNEDDDDDRQQTSETGDIRAGRERRRRRKKQGESDVNTGNEELGKRKRQKQLRRERRKRRQQRRRKRRKTRGGQSRQRRYRNKDRRQVLRNLGQSSW